MNRISYILVFSFIIGLSNISAQNKYWVFLKDKKDVVFDPYKYFDHKAINRRISNNISLYDSSDFPLNEEYVSEISEKCKVLAQSRWFNAVAVEMNKKIADEINNMEFVKDISPIYSFNKMLKIPRYKNPFFFSSDLSKKQLNVMQGEMFADNNFDGTGIRIAVFDGGFPDVDKNVAFEHIRKENRIIKTYDFVKKKEFVYSYNSHGTMVLACIAGINQRAFPIEMFEVEEEMETIKDSLLTGLIKEEKMGLATGAEFLLARTETWTEFMAEEENWMAAMEWADKNGADIISSSLGYTYHRYFTTDMDGKTSLVVKAANMAAAKGMLVVNAVGNEGSDDWRLMCTPADGDSVLSVGGISPDNHFHIDFSSYGPTIDKRMKPNVCAYGKVSTVGKKDTKTAFGTSFATPLVTGFAACAWQAKPELSNMELFKEIEKSGSLYPYYDYAHGYGVPQASYFTDSNKTEVEKTFELIIKDYYLKIKLPDEDHESSSPNNYLHYHIENKDGVLEKYVVIDMMHHKTYTINLVNQEGKTIRIHYKSYTETYEKK